MGIQLLQEPTCKMSLLHAPRGLHGFFTSFGILHNSPPSHKVMSRAEEAENPLALRRAAVNAVIVIFHKPVDQPFSLKPTEMDEVLV